MKTFIANLPLSRKFALIGLIAALMLLLPTTLLVRSDLTRLTAAKQQHAGLAPAQAAVTLMHYTQQHRGLAAVVLGGDEAAATTLQGKQAEVDKALAALQAAAAALGDQHLAGELARMADDWRALAQAVSGTAVDPAQSFQRHTALITRQLDLLEDITHVAGIVLVPDERTYFLQAAVLRELPRLTEAFGQARGLGATLLARGSAAPEDRARISQLGATVDETFREARKLFDLAVKDDEVARAAIGAALSAAMDAAQQGLKVVDERVVRAERLDYPAAQYFEVVTRAIESQFKLVDVATVALGAALDREVVAARNEIVLVLGGCGALALFGLWVMWTVTRVTTASMSAALELAESVAAGDLSGAAPEAGRDEAGQLLLALGRMKHNLAQVVGTVRGNAESVATASAQIAQGNLDLSQRTEEQASALQQTAASMEQLGSTVTQNAENARQANQLAQGASGIAGEGGAVVEQVVQTMRGINDGSRRIADIIGVIDGIAFQTNILALNAAVEAARAGEQGRGFAVVAGEVRSLAQRSAEAAKEIKTLITASVEQVAHGSELADKAGLTMREVVQAIQRVTDIMGEISAASAEQSSGVAQIGTAVTQMDQTTQQNAALVEESAAAADSLRGQAQQLVQAVAVFKLAAGAQGPAGSEQPGAAAPAPGYAGAERRGPNRAHNVSRPAFGKDRPAAAADKPRAGAKPAAAPTPVPAAPAAPADVNDAQRKATGTDDWTTF
jgi:methyl-accepting chemotaxis protein